MVKLRTLLFPDDLFYGLRVVGKRLSTIANER
jgi:hypothetical protein